MIRATAIALFGVLLLVLQGVVGANVSLHPFTPNLLLPVVLYVAVAHDVDLLVGAVLCFVLGYLLDVFGGSRMGLHTLIFSGTFLIARGAGFSLSSRGAVFQFFLTLVVAALTSATAFALRAIFEEGTPIDTMLIVTQTMLAPAFATAAMAPIVFWLVARVDALAIRRRREGAIR